MQRLVQLGFSLDPSKGGPPDVSEAEHGYAYWRCNGGVRVPKGNLAEMDQNKFVRQVW